MTPPPKQRKATLRITKAPVTARETRLSQQVHELEISLREVEPRVWRRFAVCSTTSLAKLHEVIQTVMGWYDCHLHQFVMRDGRRYAPRSPDMDLEWDADVIESRRVKVYDVLPRVGALAGYEYDFGDGWEHDLKVVAIHAPETGVRYPCCLGGERACPPEDVGGVDGYAEMLVALRNPRHREHASYVEWLGRPFDPNEFDCDAVNKLLASCR